MQVSAAGVHRICTLLAREAMRKGTQVCGAPDTSGQGENPQKTTSEIPCRMR